MLRIMGNRMQQSLVQLTWPIFVENLLRITLTSVDVFQLSLYSSKAAAAVGLINQLSFFLQLLYQMVAIGAGIVIAQNLGAGNKKAAGQASLACAMLMSVFSIVLSALCVVVAKPVLDLYQLEPAVHDYALQFFVIYGGGSVFLAFNMAQSAILRNYGYTRDPMFVNILANVINIAGNAFVLFGPLPTPIKGAMGVAISTVTSQFIACVVLALRFKNHKDVEFPLKDLLKVPRAIYKAILSVGVPTAGENLSYNICQIVIMGFIAGMGTDAMTAFVYVTTLVRFVFIISMSIGNGTQIKVGYWVGSGHEEIAAKKVYRYYFCGVGISLVLAVVINLLKVPLLSLFNPNAHVMEIAASVLFLAIIHEPGRCFNIIIIPALKGAGDVKFPVLVGMLFMWGVGVVGAYFFGVVLGWGLFGVWLGMVIDEWTRGGAMMLRWISGAWKGRSLVAKA
jgi:putative MATE family efflux protein